MIINAILLTVAYLLGSIPSAVWIGKRFYGTDVREHGSRNAGATNTLRVLGRKAALPVFLIDFLKGFAAVELSLLSSFPEGSAQLFYLRLALVVAAVLGHIFPVFAGFKGGKGVATAAGAVLAVAPAGVLLSVATFFLLLLLTKYVSLSSMLAALAFPLYLLLLRADVHLIVFGAVVAALIVITHKKNIRRLLNGTESKIYLIKPKVPGEGEGKAKQ